MDDTEYERTKEYLKGKLPMYLRSKSINVNGRFKCLNPEHRDTERSMHYERQSHTVNCSKCNARYDIFDIVGLDYKLANFEEKFRKVHEMYIGPMPDEFNKDGELASSRGKGSSAFNALKDQLSTPPNRRKIMPAQGGILDRSRNLLNSSSSIDILDAPNRKNSRQSGMGNGRLNGGLNTPRQYSMNLEPQGQSGYQKLISINPNGTVTSVETQPRTKSTKPQQNFAQRKLADPHETSLGITTINLSPEQAKQLSKSGVKRLDQLPPNLAATIRASDQAQRQQLQEQQRLQAQNQEQALGSDLMDAEGHNERLEPTFKLPSNLDQGSDTDFGEFPSPNADAADTTTQARGKNAHNEPSFNMLPPSSAGQSQSSAWTVFAQNTEDQDAPTSSIDARAHAHRTNSTNASERNFPAFPPSITQGKHTFKEKDQSVPNFFAASQQPQSSGAYAHAAKNVQAPTKSKATNIPGVSLVPLSAAQESRSKLPTSAVGSVGTGMNGANGKGAVATKAHNTASDMATAPVSVSSKVNQLYDELWGEHDKAHRAKQEAAAKAAAENEQRRLREEEYSKQLQQSSQFSLARSNNTNAITSDDDSPYLAPNQNIFEYEKAKAKRQAEAQALYEAQQEALHADELVSGNVEKYLPPTLQEIYNKPQGVAGSTTADPSSSTAANAEAMGMVGSAAASTSRLPAEIASTPIAGMVEQLNGTSNGSINNGNSRQGKANTAHAQAKDAQAWKNVFNDNELPLLNPTAPSTLINGRSYDFEQMDEKTLRNRIEQNLASDNARITAENAHTQHSLYATAKGRPEQPSTHIFGSAVSGKDKITAPDTSRQSSGDPYTTGQSLSAMVSASMAAQQSANASRSSATGASMSAGLGSSHKDTEVSTLIQRTPLSAQRTPSGALVGSTAEIHSTPSIAEQIQKELNKKQRINEQNTRIFGTLNKIEQPQEEELNTRISVSHSSTPPQPEKLPPLETRNPYSTTILSGVMKDRLQPQSAAGTSNTQPAKKEHRGPKIDFSNINPHVQDSTVTTSTSHNAQIDFTQLERDRVSTLNAQLNKPVEKHSTPLNFFARAQDAQDDPELRSKAVLLDEHGHTISVPFKHTKSRLSEAKLEELESLATLPSLEKDKKSEVDSLDLLAKVTQHATSGSHHTTDGLESTEDLNEALAKSAAAISAAAAIKAASVSLDKDLEKLGLKERAKSEDSKLTQDAPSDSDSKSADKLAYNSKDAASKDPLASEAKHNAVKELQLSLYDLDSFLNAHDKKSSTHPALDKEPSDKLTAEAKLNQNKELNSAKDQTEAKTQPQLVVQSISLDSTLDAKTSEKGDGATKDQGRIPNAEFTVKPEDKISAVQLSPEAKELALKMGIEILQAEDLLKDPSLLPPHTRVISGNKGQMVSSREQEALELIKELLTAKQAAVAAAQAASAHPSDKDAAAKADASASGPDATTLSTTDKNAANATAAPDSAITTATNATLVSAVGTALPATGAVGVPGALMPPMQPIAPIGMMPGMAPGMDPGMVGLPGSSVPLVAPGLAPSLTPNAVTPPVVTAVTAAPASALGISAAEQAGTAAPTGAEAVASAGSMAPAANGSATATPNMQVVNLSQSTTISQPQGAYNLNAQPELSQGQSSVDFWVKTKGLSLEVVEHFNLSYLKQLPVGTQVWNAGIIPLSEECQQVLNTQTGQSFFMGEEVPCFNLETLTQDTAGLSNAIFIVSLPLDALSLESLGAHAIALTKAENADTLLEYLQENLQQTVPFYVALAQDPMWAAAAERLSWGLNAMQLPFKIIELSAPYSNLNEALLSDRSGLLSKLQNPESLHLLDLAQPAAADNPPSPSATTFNQIQLLEVFAPMKDSGFILSAESLAKLQLANVLYTVTTTNVAISRLILSSVMLNQEPILFAGSKMQWQMICNRLATLPVGGVLCANSTNTVVVGTPESTNDIASGVAPQPCNARLVELPLEFDTKSLLITLTQAVMTARNSLPNFGSLRLMLDTYSFEERFCAALAPLLAELALSLNLPIMVWCTSEQRRYFEGQSIQTIEISKGMDNLLVFKTLDQDCHLHTFRSISR